MVGVGGCCGLCCKLCDAVMGTPVPVFVSRFGRLPLGGLLFFILLTSGRPFGVGLGLYTFNGEFDPGSGRTLAACLTHASRTERPACGYSSGERVSNTWATCPQLWDNSGKPVLILDIDFCLAWGVVESFSAGDGPAAYQLVGGVMAYQGDDG